MSDDGVGRRAFLAGVLGALAASGAAAKNLRMARSKGLAGKLAPSPQFTARGNGFGGDWPDAPVDPQRNIAKPAARLLNVPHTAFTQDITLVVDADATLFGGLPGVAYVDFWCEGRSLRVTEPGFAVVNDSGAPELAYGYRAVLDWAACWSAAPLGCAQCYAVAYPRDPALQPRVIAFEFYPRLSGVGEACEISKEVFVDKAAAADTPSVRYREITSALEACVAHPEWEFPAITCERDGPHDFHRPLAVASGPRERWTVIRSAPGVTAEIGDGSAMGPKFGHGYDGLCFDRSVKIDQAKLSPNLAGFRLKTNSNKRMWFRGAEVYCGVNDHLPGCSGEGMDALYEGLQPNAYWISTEDLSLPEVYWTGVHAHDLPAYGLSNAILVRGCLVDKVSGTAHENVHGAIHNTKTRRVGGILSGLRAHQNAALISYSGAGVAEMECPLNAGADNRRFKVYLDGELVLDLALSKTAGAVTQVSDLVAAVNGLGGGFAAGASTATRAAAYLSMADIQGALPITRQAITSTPKQLTTFVDIHANVYLWHSRAFENVIVRLCEAEDIVGSAWFSFDRAIPIRDFVLAQITCQDTSVSHHGQAGYSGSYIGAAASHLVIRHVTGVGGVLQLLSQFTADSRCELSRSHLNAVAWITRPDGNYPALRITGLSVSSGSTLPLGSDGLSKVQSGLTDADLFASVSDVTAPDLSPKSTSLRLADGSWAGARAPGGAGWLLAA